MLSSLAGYTGGCLSAAERSIEQVFWQLRRVRVYAGTCGLMKFEVIVAPELGVASSHGVGSLQQIVTYRRSTPYQCQKRIPGCLE